MTLRTKYLRPTAVVGVTGPAAFLVDDEDALQGIDSELLTAAAATVTMLLLLIYRSPLLCLIPLVTTVLARRLAGYEDVNDADRLCRDPAIRWAVGDRAIEEMAASASQMGRFEPKWLTRPPNLAALAALSGRWIDKVTSGGHPGSSCSTWIRARALPMASRKAGPTTATLAAPVITRCSCSINPAMWNQLGAAS
jgi:hypothetical protein